MDLTGVKASFGVDPDEVTSLTYRELQERRKLIRDRLAKKRKTVELTHRLATTSDDWTSVSHGRLATMALDAASSSAMRLVIARCSVDYVGPAQRPPAAGDAADHGQGRRVRRHPRRRGRLQAAELDERAEPAGWKATACWTVTNPKGETLTITLDEVLSDSSWELGLDPGLHKDGVEAHLQELLAANCEQPRGRACAWCAASSRPTSARSICCAATRDGAHGGGRDQASRRDRRRRAAHPLPRRS